VQSPCAASAQQAKLAIVNGIAARLMRLSPLAIEAAALVVGRLEIGQERYGDPDPDRDWTRELDDEILDEATYRGLIGVAARERTRRARITFDVSDVDEPTQPRVIRIPPLLPDPRSTFTIDDGVVSELLK
jgi:hypothetical protein